MGKARLLTKTEPDNYLNMAYPAEYRETNSQEREFISSLDLSTDANIELLNNYLSDRRILNFFKVREKLLTLSYERLRDLKILASNNSAFAQLDKLLARCISTMERESFSCPEDILVNNAPLALDCPFYEDTGSSLKITDLKHYAETLYFYNLKLMYRENSLVQKTDTLWQSAKDLFSKPLIRSLSEPTNQFPFDRLAVKASLMFSYNVKEDNKNAWIFGRQLLKDYDGAGLCPVIYEDKVILRNEYSLFCLDILSGKQIWSFSNEDSLGQEFYQTFWNPHQNSYGYELLLEGGMVFSELDAKLIAVKLRDNSVPELIWRRSLGEYTVCTKPVKRENALVAGLINSRGELWICGFNARDGNLQWNTYIGISAFLSPACTISAIENDRVYIGTNHGLLVCLNPADGEIVWLKKYAPKKYAYLDYLLQNRDALPVEYFVSYDTQFIELGGDGFLYYKPRESDYIYILDPASGSLKEEILIDSQEYYCLRALSGKMLLLEKNNNAVKDLKLKIVELESGKET